MMPRGQGPASNGEIPAWRPATDRVRPATMLPVRRRGIRKGPRARTIAAGPVLRARKATINRRRGIRKVRPAPRAAGLWGPLPLGPMGIGSRSRRSIPEMYKAAKADGDLDRLTRELAMQYRQAPPDQRDRIKKDVEKAVTQQFEVRQQRRSLELQRLTSEFQRLHAALDARAKAREQLIQKRVSDLLGHDDEAGF